MRTHLLLPIVAITACAAPPLGLGTGAHLPTTSAGELARTGVVASGAATTAAASHRRAFQVDGGLGLVLGRHFTLEGGVVYSQLSDDRDGEVFAAGGFPYLRPRLQLGPISIATAVAGLGFGGGGGGIIGGIADLQVGYGTPTWSVYAGAYEQVFEVTSEEPVRTRASQARIGGEYLMPVGAVKLGVALELYRQQDHLRGGGREIESDAFGAGLKLRIESAVFR